MVANSLAWTIRDLEVMPDDGGWKRYEIIDGELFVTRTPHFRHQRVAGKIQTRLTIWSESTQLGNVYQVTGVIFSPNDAVIPDLFWISQAREATGTDNAGHFIVAPELMVEILSFGDQNEQRDREYKLKLYSRYGIQEYWIINWQLQTLEIYRRDNAQLQLTATLLANDSLTSPLLPGFSIVLSTLFQ